MKRFLPLAVLALAAAPALAAPAARAVTLQLKSALLEWKVSWPAEANAIPALRSMIRGDALNNRARLLRFATKDRAERAKSGFPFNAYDSTTVYALAGQTPRLLSLSVAWSEFAGGAHPNHGTRGLLWDRAMHRRIAVYSMVAGGEATFARLTRSAFCAALDQARKKRRAGDDANTDPSDPFNQCPRLAELAIIPAGPAKGGRMTRFLFHADPYVAGPYVEGDYDIELPVTSAIVAALKPAYRASFAVQR